MRKSGIMILIPILISSFTLPVLSQNDAYLISQTPSLKLETVFQGWKSGSDFTIQEICTPVELYYPFSRQGSVTIDAGFAFAQGKNIASLAGFNDAQVTLNFQPNLNNLVLSLGLTLPSGKKEMPLPEFNTMALLSHNVFRFKIPVFGQGFGVSPGLTYALPISEKIVLGMGVAYQLKTAYKPIEKMPDKYKPGDEVIATGGLDVSLGEAENISADLLWAQYMADKLGGDEIYHAGNKIILSVQYQKAIQRDMLVVSALYRNRAKNRIYVFFDSTTKEVPQLQPNEAEFAGIYRYFVSNKVSWKGSADIRFLFKTGNMLPINILELGIGPEWNAAPNLVVPASIKFSMGWIKGGKTLKGLSIAAGLVYRF